MRKIELIHLPFLFEGAKIGAIASATYLVTEQFPGIFPHLFWQTMPRVFPNIWLEILWKNRPSLQNCKIILMYWWLTCCNLKHCHRISENKRKKGRKEDSLDVLSLKNFQNQMPVKQCCQLTYMSKINLTQIAFPKYVFLKWVKVKFIIFTHCKLATLLSNLLLKSSNIGCCIGLNLAELCDS